MTKKLLFLVGWLGVAACYGQTTFYYVAHNPPASGHPYTNWDIAATNIQDAVNAATNAGERVVVISNGTYMLNDHVWITNALHLRGVSDDPAQVILNGNNYPGKPVTNRCLIVSNAAARLTALTLTGGVALAEVLSGDGGGVWFYGAMISNCVVTGNEAQRYGGGIYRSTITLPSIAECIIENNKASDGGGSYMEAATTQGMLQNCIIRGNTCANYGGGVYSKGRWMYRGCLIYNNVASAWGGGAYVAHQQTPRNVESCTIVSNRAGTRGGGMLLGYADTPVVNSIIYYNTCTSGGTSNIHYLANGYFTNCCFAQTGTVAGVNNITNLAPGFVSATGQDYHLEMDSPCVNAGANQDWMSDARDLEGNRRIDGMWRRVDIGAYEGLWPATIITVR